jgi:hypothetical protein
MKLNLIDIYIKIVLFKILINMQSIHKLVD